MDYKNKYLKYKNKYLNLKKMFGGTQQTQQQEQQQFFFPGDDYMQEIIDDSNKAIEEKNENRRKLDEEYRKEQEERKKELQEIKKKQNEQNERRRVETQRVRAQRIEAQRIEEQRINQLKKEEDERLEDLNNIVRRYKDNNSEELNKIQITCNNLLQLIVNKIDNFDDNDISNYYNINENRYRLKKYLEALCTNGIFYNQEIQTTNMDTIITNDYDYKHIIIRCRKNIIKFEENEKSILTLFVNIFDINCNDRYILSDKITFVNI
jgi:hypothetical protein